MLTLRRTLASLLLASAALSAATEARAAILVTLGAPGAEFANITGAGGVCDSEGAGATCEYGTETFSGWHGGGFTSSFTTGQNNFGGGISVSGTYSGAIVYDTDNTYGGAYGTNPYPSANGASVYSLRLASSGIPGVNYFGVWITAMDPSNKLVIYSGGQAVFSFISSDLRAAIQQQPNPTSYYGDPDNHKDTSEPFAYVNIFDTTGYIDRIDFTNSGGSNFESSDHSVGYFAPAPMITQPSSQSNTQSGTLGAAGGTTLTQPPTNFSANSLSGAQVIITTDQVSTIGEPAAGAVLTGALLALAAVRRRRPERRA